MDRPQPLLLRKPQQGTPPDINASTPPQPRIVHLSGPRPHGVTVEQREDLAHVGSRRMGTGMNQRQLQLIEYLREENRVLREQLGARQVGLNDNQRRSENALQAKQNILLRDADQAA